MLFLRSNAVQEISERKRTVACAVSVCYSCEHVGPGFSFSAIPDRPKTKRSSPSAASNLLKTERGLSGGYRFRLRDGWGASLVRGSGLALFRFLETASHSCGACFLSDGRQPGLQGQIAKNPKSNDNHGRNPDPNVGEWLGKFLPNQSPKNPAPAKQGRDGKEDDKQGIQQEGFAKMTVQQLMCGAEPTTARAIPTRDHMEETTRIETVGRGIKPKQDGSAHEGGSKSKPDEK